MMVSRKIVAIIFILALGISLATAEEIRHHEFDTNDINRLSLDIRTGHIIVEHHDQQVISSKSVSPKRMRGGSDGRQT